jgi:hypothetical protein
VPDIQIFQIDPTTGLGTLELGNAPKELAGIQLLAQIVALSFLRDPGQDVIDPTEGAGVRQDIGNLSVTSEDEANLLIMQRTKVVETEVLSRQTVGIGDPSEKLLSLTVLDVASNLSEAQIMTRIKVTSETGQSTEILV